MSRKIYFKKGVDFCTKYYKLLQKGDYHMNQVLNLQIPKELSDKLSKEKEETGVSKSEIVRRAIVAYLDGDS